MKCKYKQFYFNKTVSLIKCFLETVLNSGNHTKTLPANQLVDNNVQYFVILDKTQIYKY